MPAILGLWGSELLGYWEGEGVPRPLPPAVRSRGPQRGWAREARCCQVHSHWLELPRGGCLLWVGATWQPCEWRLLSSVLDLSPGPHADPSSRVLLSPEPLGSPPAGAWAPQKALQLSGPRRCQQGAEGQSGPSLLGVSSGFGSCRQGLGLAGGSLYNQWSGRASCPPACGLCIAGGALPSPWLGPGGETDPERQSGEWPISTCPWGLAASAGWLSSVGLGRGICECPRQGSPEHFPQSRRRRPSRPRWTTTTR